MENKKQKLQNFIKNAIQEIKAGFNGCYYYRLGETANGVSIYYVIAAQERDAGNIVCGKIAVNCDDLQCDFEFDWYIPFWQDGCLLYDEDICEEQDAKKLAGEILHNFNFLKKGYVFKNGLTLERAQDKESARLCAVEWLEVTSEQRLSYYDMMNAYEYFEKIGRRFGLLKEFRENGFC